MSKKTNPIWHWLGGWGVTQKGGPTSGNWGHAGVKGQHGGSAPKSGPGAAMSLATGRDWQERQAAAGEAAALRERMLAEYDDLEGRLDASRSTQLYYYDRAREYSEKELDPLNDQRQALVKAQKWGTPEYKRVNAEYVEKYKEWEKLHQKYVDAVDEGRDLATKKLTVGLDVLEVPKDKQANVTLSSHIKIGRDEAQAGLDIFNRLCGTGTVDGEKVQVVRNKNSRSSYSLQFDKAMLGYQIKGGGMIKLSKNAHRSTMLHEMGHWLEDHDPEVRRKAAAFLASRTRGESVQKMADLRPRSNYKPYEVTKPDEFMSPYMGKQYAGATEIISMGIEYILTKPVRFAKEDPKYFDFMIKVLRGKG